MMLALLAHEFSILNSLPGFKTKKGWIGNALG
jgi:hypothetical protein